MMLLPLLATSYRCQVAAEVAMARTVLQGPGHCILSQAFRWPSNAHESVFVGIDPLASPRTDATTAGRKDPQLTPHDDIVELDVAVRLANHGACPILVKTNVRHLTKVAPSATKVFPKLGIRIPNV